MVVWLRAVYRQTSLPCCIVLCCNFSVFQDSILFVEEDGTENQLERERKKKKELERKSVEMFKTEHMVFLLLVL